MAPTYYIESEAEDEDVQIIGGSLSSASSLDSLDNWVELAPLYSSNESKVIVDIQLNAEQSTSPVEEARALISALQNKLEAKLSISPRVEDRASLIPSGELKLTAEAELATSQKGTEVSLATKTFATSSPKDVRLTEPTPQVNTKAISLTQAAQPSSQVTMKLVKDDRDNKSSTQDECGLLPHKQS